LGRVKEIIKKELRIMKPELSAGAIIFYHSGQKIKYLLLHHEADYWNFPKGHIETGESVLVAARREVQEETGLTALNFIPGFKVQDKYIFQFNQKKVFKIVIFLLAEAKSQEVKISDEHIGFRWLTYEQAIKQLKFKNIKIILQRANDSILNV